MSIKSWNFPYKSPNRRSTHPHSPSQLKSGLIQAKKLSWLRIVSGLIKFYLTFFADVISNVLRRIYGLYYLAKQKVIRIKQPFIIFCYFLLYFLISLIYANDAIFWIVLFIHMKVTGLLFKMSIFGPNTGGIFYMIGNVMFFVKEIFLGLLMAQLTIIYNN